MRNFPHTEKVRSFPYLPNICDHTLGNYCIETSNINKKTTKYAHLNWTWQKSYRYKICSIIVSSRTSRNLRNKINNGLNYIIGLNMIFKSIKAPTTGLWRRISVRASEVVTCWARVPVNSSTVLQLHSYKALPVINTIDNLYNPQGG